MSPGRLAAFAGIAIVGAAIAVGLYISGSPAEQRLLRFDERRRAELGSLASAVARHVTETGTLPESLDKLADGRTLTRVPRDPETDRPYEYEITGPRTFQLCASFNRESPADLQGDFWSHGEGRACFPFDYSNLDRR